MIASRRAFMASAAALALSGYAKRAHAVAAEPGGFVDGPSRNEVFGYGPMKADPYGLLDLPEGFSYRVVSQAGETMAVSGLDGGVLEVSNVLVTHLHSYATPLIRYEVGDSAVIGESCPCGHQGTTLSHIHGRRKNFVRTRDGAWVFLPIFSKPLSDLAPFKAFFFEQLEPGRVLLWWVPEGELSAHARASLVAYLRGVSRADLDFDIRVTDHIDWSHNPKRVPFICRV